MNTSIGWSPLPTDIPRGRHGCPTGSLLLTVLVVADSCTWGLTRLFLGVTKLWRDDCVARWLARRADLHSFEYKDSC